MSSVTVTVDTNAAEDALFENVQTLLDAAKRKSKLKQVWLTRERLDIGDVRICCNSTSNEGGSARTLLVERKHADDWRASIADGRYHEQKARYLAHAASAASCHGARLKPRVVMGTEVVSGIDSEFHSFTRAHR